MITLIALVSRNRTADRSAIARRLAAALDQQPGADRDAARATERHGRAERQFAERDARTEPDGRAVEHLQEREDVAEAGEDLQPDADQQPAHAHVANGVRDAAEARDREQQADDDRDQDRERDQAAPQTAPGLLLPAPQPVVGGRRRSTARRIVGGAAMVDYSSSDNRRGSRAIDAVGDPGQQPGAIHADRNQLVDRVARDPAWLIDPGPELPDHVEALVAELETAAASAESR